MEQNEIKECNELSLHSISFNLFRSGLYFIVIDSKTFKVIKI